MRTSAPTFNLTRRSLALGALGVGASACDASSAPRGAPRALRQTPLDLRRGIGVHHMLNWAEMRDRDYVWPPFVGADSQVSAEEMANLRAHGFDFVRLTIGPDIFMASHGRRSRDLASILIDRVSRFREAELNVVVDLHPTSRHPAYTGERLWDGAGALVFRRYVEIVAEISRTLRRFEEGVALELMNEPQAYGLGATPRWRAMTQRMINASRREAPRLPLVVSGAYASAHEGLLELAPFDADRLIYTFHHYGPLAFTHQSVIDSVRYVSRLPWPASRGDLDAALAQASGSINADRRLSDTQRREAIAATREALGLYFERGVDEQTINAEFDAVAQWADRNGVARGAVLLGEFGVVRTHRQYRGAADDDRARWLQIIRMAAERNGFAWSVWVYRGDGGMALADEDDVLNLDATSLRALGLGG